MTKEFKVGDIVKFKYPDVNDESCIIIKIYNNFNSIPKTEIYPYDVDSEAYYDNELNDTWYRVINEVSKDELDYSHCSKYELI